MADISQIKLPNGDIFDLVDESKSTATNWVNGSQTGSVRTVNSKVEDSSYTMGLQAVAEGDGTKASGNYSHAEGTHTIANHLAQHVFGEYNIADASTATTSNRGNYIEIVGNGSSSTRSNARTLDWSGNEVLAGKLTVGTVGANSMDVATIGQLPTKTSQLTNDSNFLTSSSSLNAANLSGQISNTVISTSGIATTSYVTTAIATKQDSLVSGTNIKTINNQSLLGSGNITIEAGTSGITNLVDGSSTGSVRGINAAEENSSYTMGADAVAEGISTKASGVGSHAEGQDTIASGRHSHAEGFASHATGDRSHVEGHGTWATQGSAHAEGSNTTASGIASHAQNLYTIARGEYQTAIGKYNISQGTNDSYVNTDHAFIIGNGTSDSARSNALTVDWLGNVDIASGAMYKINGTALSASDVGAVPTSRTVNGKALSSNISLTASDVSAVPTTRTVNGKALSSDISLDASDVSAIPTTRTVNGKALSSNISLTASDVSALPDTTAIPSKTSDLTNDSGFFKKAYAYIDEVTATTITAVSTAGRKKVPIESLKERIGFTYDSTNKGIIVSESGMYAISITLSVNPATSGDLMGALVYQNSSVLMGPSYKRIGGNYDEIVVSPVIAQLNAGDVLTLYCQNNTGGRGTITSGKLAVWRVG